MLHMRSQKASANWRFDAGLPMQRPEDSLAERDAGIFTFINNQASFDLIDSSCFFSE